MKVSTVEQMRALDRRAIEEFGIPEAILMENAGLAAAAVIRRELGVRGRRFVVVCGLGNNGGDGLVVARRLHSEGGQVRVLVAGGVGRYGGASRQNLELALRVGIEVVADATAEQVRDALVECDALVDGLLGTGLSGEVGGRYGAIIEAIEAAAPVVFSLDIPSGVDGDTGQVRGVALHADATIAFGLPKLGNLLYPGFERCGRLFVSHISFPPQLTEGGELGVEVSLPPALEPRRSDGHKGSFGDVLFIAGAAGYYGAPSLAALSFLKAGGGYSRLAAPRSVVPQLAPLASEVIFLPQEETVAGSLSLRSAERLLALSQDVDLVVLGPGLSLVDETQQLVRRLVAELDKPLLLDGDGLTAIATRLDLVRGRPAPTALTPHHGELARLSGRTVGAIRGDQVGAVREVCRDLGAAVVLKGAHSLIGLPDQRVFVNVSGNSGMGTAGSGDVLTGVIAAAFGLGQPFEEALRTGVFLHGLAGDLAAQERGEDGITARDILEGLPAALRTYRADHDELAEALYGVLEVV